MCFTWLSCCSLQALSSGFIGIALRVADGKPADLKQLTAFLRRGPAFLLGFCIYSVAVGAGLVFFILPGIYVAARYALFPQVLAAKPVSALEAMSEAAALSSGRWRTVCLFLLIALGLNLLGAALLGLGFLVTFPITLVATSLLYRSFQQSADLTRRQADYPMRIASKAATVILRFASELPLLWQLLLQRRDRLEQVAMLFDTCEHLVRREREKLRVLLLQALRDFFPCHGR